MKRSWLWLAGAILLHVVDEALHDFLALWNPMVLWLRQSWPWLPLPVFSFHWWLGGLLAGVALMVLLASHVPRRAVRVLAALMIANACGHFAGSLYLGRPMAGVWSSPILLAAAINCWRRAGDANSNGSTA